MLSDSDYVFVVAAVTSENQGFLGADAFARMRRGAAFILLSRADVVDFPALMAAVEQRPYRRRQRRLSRGAAAADHPVRPLPGFLRSAHRAGALDIAFKRMGDMVLEDMDLIDRGLPPLRGKRAERETVHACARSRSTGTRPAVCPIPAAPARQQARPSLISAETRLVRIGLRPLHPVLRLQIGLRHAHAGL